jgi:DNA mismatch endonuclease (patch repair protein)
MRAVKSTDTTPEMQVRRFVHKLGYRYRLHRQDLPGKPDIVFPRLKRVLFVNGCFWHGHACARGDRPPKNNAEYWKAKIEKNRLRDSRHQETLTAQGWKSLIIWECALAKNRAATEHDIRQFLAE